MCIDAVIMNMSVFRTCLFSNKENKHSLKRINLLYEVQDNKKIFPFYLISYNSKFLKFLEICHS